MSNSSFSSLCLSQTANSVWASRGPDLPSSYGPHLVWNDGPQVAHVWQPEQDHINSNVSKPMVVTIQAILQCTVQDSNIWKITISVCFFVLFWECNISIFHFHLNEFTKLYQTPEPLWKYNSKKLTKVSCHKSLKCWQTNKRLLFQCVCGGAGWAGRLSGILTRKCSIFKITAIPVCFVVQNQCFYSGQTQLPIRCVAEPSTSLDQLGGKKD